MSVSLLQNKIYRIIIKIKYNEGIYLLSLLKKILEVMLVS